jgi:hypothetical protein
MLRPIALAAAALLIACASTTPNQEAAVSAVAYPLAVCPTSGEALPEQGYATATINGRELRYCCQSCATAALADPAAAQAAFEAELMAAQRPGYPLEVCVVAGSPLDSMGGPHDILVGDRLVRLCCAGCAKTVAQDPQAILATLDQAAAR